MVVRASMVGKLGWRRRKMQIELKEWQAPNYIIGVMPAGKRQDGFNPDPEMACQGC